MNVGDVHETNYWGAAEVVQLLAGREIVVKFVDTGNVRTTRSDYLLLGNVQDAEAVAGGLKSKKKVIRSRCVIVTGQLFPSNCCGMMEVVEYRGSKDIQIRFVDSGNHLSVQKYALESGQVKDVGLRKRLLVEKECIVKEAREVRELAWQRTREAEDARKIRAEATKEANKEVVRRAGIQRKAEARDTRFEAMKATLCTNGFGDSYSILRRGVKEGTVVVEFASSANQYEVGVVSASRGSVLDVRCPAHQKAFKDRARRRCAEWYETNRERALARSGAYQRNNLEATRERNRRNLQKRTCAEGSHTQQEKSNLLKMQGWRCNCCGYDLRIRKQIDHIMPITLGGSNDIGNMQWLCQVCNSVKSDRHPDDWAIYSASDEFKARLLQRRKI